MVTALGRNAAAALPFDRAMPAVPSTCTLYRICKGMSPRATFIGTAEGPLLYACGLTRRCYTHRRRACAHVPDPEQTQLPRDAINFNHRDGIGGAIHHIDDRAVLTAKAIEREVYRR